MKSSKEGDEKEEFEMKPVEKGEKCSGRCKKTIVARVFCEDSNKVGGKVHTLCTSCLAERYRDGKLRLESEEARFVECPMIRCTHRIPICELEAAMRDTETVLHDRLESMRKTRLQQQNAGGAGGANKRDSSASSTPLLDRRLSQEDGENQAVAVSSRLSLNLSWTAKAASATAAAEEEEPPVMDEEAEELRQMAGLVDREKLNQLQVYFPEAAVGWLVRHSDYGMEALIQMVTNGQADPKMRERADGRGATTIVQTTLRDRKQFECSVCFGDFDEHLAITCVYMGSRRDSGEMAPTEEQLAKEKTEEERGRKELHKFCSECVIGHAKAAQEQQVILRAGVGIKCMEDRCNNALLRAHIEQVLDAKTRAILDPLLSNEALIAANSFDDVEKCQRCPFSGAMADKVTQPVFVCGDEDCLHSHCRKCGRSYDEAHVGRTCEELDPEAMRKRVEEQLTEQTMFKCPRCKKGIVKTEGCNKITCICGQFSCYVCKQAIDGYDHFKQGPGEKNKCAMHGDPNRQAEKARQATLQQQIQDAADETVKDQLRRLM